MLYCLCILYRAIKLQEWYDLKNAVEEAMAEEWLEEHDLEIKEGKIVRSKFLKTECVKDNVLMHGI